MKTKTANLTVQALGLLIIIYILTPSATNATLTTFTDKNEFLTTTGATSATGPLPNLSPTTVSTLTIGSVTITTLSGALWFGAEGVSETDWTLRLEGLAKWQRPRPAAASRIRLR